MKALSGLIFLALAAAGSGCDRGVRKAAPHETGEQTGARAVLAEKVVAGWSDGGRLAARALIEKYGAPDDVRASSLFWGRRGPWKTTVVRDAPPPYAGSATTELGVVEQTIDYPLDPGQARTLEAFGATLTADAGKSELTARSDSERVNFLRVNLADEVLRGYLTVDQARHAYERIMALEGAGGTTGYMSALRFARGPKAP